MQTWQDFLAGYIRDVPDFPKPGVVFKDITPLLKSPPALAMAVELLAQPFRGRHIDLVVGAESRGFIFGVAVAQALSAGFAPIRKPGKLPCPTNAMEFDLEYGTDSLEIHTDAIEPGQKIAVIDDVLATGGTMKACCDLVSALGGDIAGVAVLIELDFLHGRDKLGDYNITSALHYD